MLTNPVRRWNMAFFDFGTPTVCEGSAPPGAAGQPVADRGRVPGATVGSRVRRAVGAASIPFGGPSGSGTAEPRSAPACSPPTFPTADVAALDTTSRHPAISFTQSDDH